ncbi:alpha/beta hydrolase [Streptomyces sp. PSKA54]|uniref:Alpha/beta hydrolase n=1 Tax=Streptomyces himalayensis subsp. aureolus TaxID=2758039 RepID=A0A7W2HKC2_9ACTN|nr:alpha/beta hydrolase [Streptomyces himalayensis]MBA4867016.1 alpha/beta hydrolase [Streptomyces himalayensis subsp. aureolus]
MADGVSRPTLLLVHGAWHGAWCWKKLRSVLEADGWRTRAIDLPSAGGRAGMHDDAQTVLGELELIDGPVVVVAHSYGGIPVSQAAAEAAGNVSHIVYLAALQLDVGESLLGFVGAPVPPEPRDFEPAPNDPIAMFYGDVPRPEAEEAVKRLVPQSTKSFSDVLTQAAWHTVPSTYIVCEDDQALPAQSQQLLASRSGAVHRVESSHSPFMSKPEELAALLAKIALESDA